MESQENNPPYGSQTGTPQKTTSPNFSKENSVGRLTRQSSIRTTDRPHPQRMTSEEFGVFSQQVGNISLAEAKDHLQNLGPVPTLLDPLEVINRKLLEKEEIKTIRRDSVSFLKRRTSERKTNLTTPALTTTAEGLRTSFISSTTPPDSATPVEMAPPILRLIAAANTAVSSDAAESNEGWANRNRRPVGVRDSSLTPREQQDATSRAQANERTTDNFLAPSTGLGTAAFLPRTSSMPRPLGSSGVVAAPVTTTGWVSDPYASNYGTPPASAAARAMGFSAWQNQGHTLPIPPVVPSQNQPVSLEWLYGAPIRSPLASATGSRETTPDLVYSSDGSEEFEKRKANGLAGGSKPEHKQAKPDVPGTGRGVGGAGSATPQQ
ncbi:hypothetical protein EYC80_006835 [Monilinia laxa]|uniref:Uncharacterized protein n=1 Tax=Monilinia laxa TaxID=61186 RepID=A0A5N6JZA8_MONLA|nr:hypothetical protein EYC80_006835 [Monilinia laxa]